MSSRPGDFALALISSPLLPGLEYSAGEGTNYPPKFDSAPGKPVFKSCFLMQSLFCLSHSLPNIIVLNGLSFSQVLGDLPQRSGALRTGMKM